MMTRSWKTSASRVRRGMCIAVLVCGLLCVASNAHDPLRAAPQRNDTDSPSVHSNHNVTPPHVSSGAWRTSAGILGTVTPPAQDTLIVVDDVRNACASDRLPCHNDGDFFLDSNVECIDPFKESVSTDNAFENHAYWSNASQEGLIAICLPVGVRWKAYLPADGLYKVQAYIPRVATMRADTSYAEYTIHAADGRHTVLIDQNSNAERWVDLGEYRFESAVAVASPMTIEPAMVDLGSDTQDAALGRSVLYDAVRWCQGNGCTSVVSPVQVNAYLQNIQEGSTVDVGSSVRICYSVSRPVGIRWLYCDPDCRVLVEDTGTGECRTSTVKAPSGKRTSKIEARENGQTIASDEASFYVREPGPAPRVDIQIDGGCNQTFDWGARYNYTYQSNVQGHLEVYDCWGASASNCQYLQQTDVAPGEVKSGSYFGRVQAGPHWLEARLTTHGVTGRCDYSVRDRVPDTPTSTPSPTSSSIPATPTPTRTPPSLEVCKQSGGDTDGDGLCNDWEIHGYGGVNLPAMGADPYRKDIFVEMDYFSDARPEVDFVKKVAEAFARQNISLHVDLENLFGAYSGSNKITGRSSIKWNQFQAIKGTNFGNFDGKRSGVFHYALAVSGLDVKGESFNGLGENPFDEQLTLDGKRGDDMIVVMAGHSLITQAGVFMHELGHNLGLSHGGTPDRGIVRHLDNTLNKPNHLSVMNYTLGWRGLIYRGEEGYLDYAHYDLETPLDEIALDERVGINGGFRVADYGTRWFCPKDQVLQLFQWPPSGFTKKANGPIDWDCYSDATGTTINDINGDLKLQTLRAYSEWDKLNFTGGDITGGLAVASAASASPATRWQDTELPFEPPPEWGEQLSSPYWVRVSAPEYLSAPLGGELELQIIVKNAGTESDNYTITGALRGSGLNIVSVLPSSVSVPANEARTVRVRVRVIPSASSGTEAEIGVTARSTNSPRIEDVASTTISLLAAPTATRAVAPTPTLAPLHLPFLMRNIQREALDPVRTPGPPAPPTQQSGRMTFEGYAAASRGICWLFALLDGCTGPVRIYVDANVTSMIAHLDTWITVSGYPSMCNGVPYLKVDSITADPSGRVCDRTTVTPTKPPRPTSTSTTPATERSPSSPAPVVTSTPTPGSGAGIMNVDSRQGWQATPLLLQDGDSLRVNYVSGDWTIDSHSYGHVGPEGYATDPVAHQGCKVLSSSTYGTLVARIGQGSPFAVGRGGSFEASSSGILSLRINDGDGCLNDNEGIVAVSLSRSQLSCPGKYLAEYFNNRSLSGTPVYSRCENRPIVQDWGTGGPGNGVTDDNFSARWTARVHLDTGSYTFIATADDGIQVWLDGYMILDGWRDQWVTEYRTTQMVSNGDHDIRVQYYENEGGAVAKFRWEPD